MFTVFDRDAALLLGRSWSDILEGINQGGLNNGMSAEFEALIGRKLLFKVEVRQYINSRFERTFSVRKYTDEISIIDRFKRRTQVSSPHLYLN